MYTTRCKQMLTLDKISKLLLGCGYTCYLGNHDNLFVYGSNKECSLAVIVINYATKYKDSIFVLPSYHNRNSIEDFKDKLDSLNTLLKSLFEHDYIKIDGYSKLRLIHIKDS